MSKTIKITDEDNRTGEVLVAYSLYESNANYDTVTLSDSAANYEYMEIYYITNDNHTDMTKVYKPNGRIVGLRGCMMTGVSGSDYDKYRAVKISDTTISTYNSKHYELPMPSGQSLGSIKEADVIGIIKVVGYK